MFSIKLWALWLRLSVLSSLTENVLLGSKQHNRPGLPTTTAFVHCPTLSSSVKRSHTTTSTTRSHAATFPKSRRTPRPPVWRSKRSKRRPFLKPTLLAAGAFIALFSLTLAYFAPFLAPAAAIQVNGATSEYTIVLQSYGPRLSLLKGAIRHYSACPSAAEVLVVWNAGPPPDAGALQSRVPVRVRAEAQNSLNNRFKPDSEISSPAVFSVDDDIRIPCTDVEAAFAAWRRDSGVMVGFFPRMIDKMKGEAELRFCGETNVMQTLQYNAVLTGAAFLDPATAFPAYWAPSVAPARQVVDDILNGEDLLMNFVLANATGGSGKPVVRFMRPTRRMDISKFSGVGLSHDMASFEEGTRRYLRAFKETFGGNPLKVLDVNMALGSRGKPWFCGTKLGCVYL